MKRAYQTERLILRPWKQRDRRPFAALNGDAEVMRYFLNTLTPSQSNEMADLIEHKMAANGWGFWAVDEKRSGTFIGFVGLNIPGYTLPFSPFVEIGWRLCQSSWGKGYAPEAALKALEIGFEQYGMKEILAFTALQNLPSQRVMEKIGMTRGEEFDHPGVPEGHALLRHVVYRAQKI